MKNLGCAFTGHRHIVNTHRSQIGDLISRAVAFAYREGCRRFYSGGAVGFDTLAAREVLRFRISHPDVRLCLILPCTNQDERWSERDKESYAYILREADEVSYISETYTHDCMKKRNYALAAEADIMIAYVGESASGSAQTVRMAEKMNKRVYNIYPTLVRKEESK